MHRAGIPTFHLLAKEGLALINALPQHMTATGTVECDKQADFVVWDAEDVNELLYRYGTNRTVAVYKKGIPIQ